MAVLFAAVLMVSAAPDAPPVKAPALADEEPADGTYQGPTSSYLARPAVITFGDKLGASTKVTWQNKPGQTYGETTAVREAIAKYGLATARRHFEDASWPPVGKNKKKKPRYEMRIKKVTVQASKGPAYNVTVEMERVEQGRRRGSATGRGYGAPDRTNQRYGAAMVPGIFGMAARHKASQPSLQKDAKMIEVATVRALDNAIYQTAMIWAGEQRIEEMQKQYNKK